MKHTRTHFGLLAAGTLLLLSMGFHVLAREGGSPAADAPGPTYVSELAALDRQVESLLSRAERESASWLHLSWAAESVMRRGKLTGHLDDYALADSILAQAFRVAPEGAGPFLARAELNASLHRFDRVKEDLSRAESELLLGERTRAAIIGLRADVDFQQGRYAAAVEGYEKALHLQPSLAAHARLAQVYARTGDFNRAEAHLREAGSAYGSPGQPRAWVELQLGLLDLDRGRWEDALEHYRAADRELPGWWLVEEHMAEVQLLLGRRNEAIERYRDLVTRTGDPEFMDALAAALRAGGDVEAGTAWTARARHAYEARLRRFPEASAGHALRHYLNDVAADHETATRMAVELAEKNRDLRPGAESHMLLARAYASAGRLEEARRAIEAALETPWRTAELYKTAAEIYGALHRPERAREEWDKAHAINPRIG